MRTKNSSNQSNVSSLYVNNTSETEINNVFETISMKNYVYNTTYDSILLAHNTKNVDAYICELNYSGKHSVLHKSEWNNALNSAMDFYIGQENYEKCGQVRDLISII